ncbi:hypothetical protein CF640_37425 [Burkholderia pseudomallei]|nr:hypothetical protein CF640_37425 [Burkholderia pseudomallei]
MPLVPVVVLLRQMAACEVRLSLVGSEMCIRERAESICSRAAAGETRRFPADGGIGTLPFVRGEQRRPRLRAHPLCALYTSDDADDLLCVDLCGRRTCKLTLARTLLPYIANL